MGEVDVSSTLPLRFHYASTTLPMRCCYDPTTKMKIWLRLVYGGGDVADLGDGATFLYPFYIESEVRFASTTTWALLLRFYYALAVSATIRVILTKISNRSGIAVQWNGGGG